MKTLALFLISGSCLLAQITVVGSSINVGASQISSAAPAPFTPITLTTNNNISPNNTISGTGSMGSGFPTVTLGGSPVPAQGYQGGQYIAPNSTFPNGAATLVPWQVASTVPHGTFLGYVGGPAGTFHCTGIAGAGGCPQNYSWMDMTVGVDSNAKGTTCQGILDNNGIMYMMPGVDNQTGDFVAWNSNGTAATSAGAGGVSNALTNSANYAFFNPPSTFKASGRVTGWCTAAFDPIHGKVYFAPTAGGTAQVSFCNPMLLQYNQSGGSFPAQFTSSNFTPFNLEASSGGANIPNACGYLSIVWDNGKNMYLLPINGAPMVIYDTTASFTTAASYKAFVMSNLGTGGANPTVSGNGNLAALQGSSGFVGGDMIWDAAGANEYLYGIPFAVNPGGTAQGTQRLQSTVFRVKVATCGSPVPGSQACASGFTAVNITAATSNWEIFDLSTLSTNQEWTTAGYGYPPVYGPTSTYMNNTLANQLVLGGMQLGWVNNSVTTHPKACMIADFGSFYVCHDASKTLNDPSGYSIFQRPGQQVNGCMGGSYDAVDQLLYTSCPARTGQAPSGFQIGPV